MLKKFEPIVPHKCDLRTEDGETDKVIGTHYECSECKGIWEIVQVDVSGLRSKTALRRLTYAQETSFRFTRALEITRASLR